MDVQLEMIHTLPGLENCEVMRPAYAIEYDLVNPLELKPSLETKKVEGLFLAGQINGTSGSSGPRPDGRHQHRYVFR